ncbi:MAG: hypothetical protein V4723_12625 [Pseudomonadota bacterium]
MLDAVRESGARLQELGSVLWRCFYSVSLTVLGVVGLAFVPQGKECLRLMSEPGWNFPLFLFSVTIWSLAAWYSARLTLGRVFETSSVIDLTDTRFINFMRLWLPRTLGVLPGSVLTCQFYLLGANVLALACAGVTLAIGLFVLKRRAWFERHFGGWETGRERSVRFACLKRRTVITVVSAIGLSFVLLAAIWWQPVAVTAVVTAPVLLCLALASWILFGDLVLTYFFKQARLPSMAAAPLALFIVFSFWNDNHGVDLVAGDAGPVLRRGVGERLDAWLEARASSGELQPGKTFPVYLVASEGGGIRAAYWAGMVLAKLQDDSQERFARHLFALSGVSGGALASATFAALVADSGANTLGTAPCAAGARTRLYQQCTRQVLRRDFLSPTLGYLLYPDMLQRFLPLPIPKADRARAMETSWAAAWRQATGSSRLQERFDQLWKGDKTLGVPSLLLNATLVNGGNRLITSDVVIDGRFPDAYDSFDPLLDLRQISLASAVHNSARFSYLSPAGTVYGCQERERFVACDPSRTRTAWGRVIDGGYFESSGVEAVRDLLFAMRPMIAKWSERGFHIDPVVLVISNAPGAMAPSGKQDPRKTRMEMTFLSEILAPPLGLFKAGFARATFAVAAERRDMEAVLPVDPDRFIWFGMRTEHHTPLGWALSEHTFNGIDALLSAPHAAKLPFAKVLGRLPPP